MAGDMSRIAKLELLASIQKRYQGSSKRDEVRILDEFIAVTGHHRKHGIRLLGKSGDAVGQVLGVKGRRIYNEAVREAVILVWEASESGATPSGRVHGTPRPPGPGPRGEGTPPFRQCCHLGPTTQARQDHGGKPAEAPP